MLSDKRLAKMKAAHMPHYSLYPKSAVWCMECSRDWPCETSELLAEIERLKEYADDLAGQLPMI